MLREKVNGSPPSPDRPTSFLPYLYSEVGNLTVCPG